MRVKYPTHTDHIYRKNLLDPYHRHQTGGSHPIFRGQRRRRLQMSGGFRLGGLFKILGKVAQKAIKKIIPAAQKGVKKLLPVAVKAAGEMVTDVASGTKVKQALKKQVQKGKEQAKTIIKKQLGAGKKTRGGILLKRKVKVKKDIFSGI
jgi:hypothetical protein